MPEDEWGVDQPRLSDMTLDEVLTGGESEADRELAVHKTSVRVIPLGMISATKKLAFINRMRITTLQRLYTRHGVALIRDDRRCLTISSLVNQALTGQPQTSRNFEEMIATLEGRRHIAPVYSRAERITIRMYTPVHEYISDLSYDLGLYNSDILICACLMSLSTSKQLGEFRPNFDREVERFWSSLDNRRGEIS